MRFLNFTLIKLCLGFIIGIYLGFIEVLSFEYVLIFGTVCVALLFLFRFIFKHKLLFLTLSVLLFMVLGYATTSIHLPKNQPHHLYHLDLKSQPYFSVSARVSETLRANSYNDKYILNDLLIDGQIYQGKILLNVSKSTETQTVNPGDDILLYTKLLPFQNPKNPQTFDYAVFMQNRDVYAVIYEDEFEVFPQASFSITTWASLQRQNIVSSLREAGFQEKHLELIQALILGQKQSINKEIYDEFAEVGVVHILAVSGLHVGIVFLILQFLFKPFLRLKHGRLIRVLLTILALWGFAALAGFSPSVMRAVTMFSFLSLGQLFKRKTNSINMLALSALALLIYRPQLLFEVGFQLSYAAVFAIIMLYPIFSKLYSPHYKIPKIFWDTAYVSLAAQIGVLPFQLYYFHQFPGLFLLGNLVIIPFLGLLLSGGILCITLALLGILISPFVEAYAYLLDLLVAYVDWLSQFKALVFQSIFFTKPMFIAIMLTVFCFIIMMRSFKKTSISVFLIAGLVFCMISIEEFSKTDHCSELVIFHKSRQSLIGVKQGQHLQVYGDTSQIQDDAYWYTNYKLINRISDIDIKPLKNSYHIKENKLMVVDSTGIYLSETENPVVLLTGSPDIHLEKLISIQKPKQIIADGNNYKSYVDRWRTSAEKYNIPFHSTYEDGYLRFNLR